MKVRTGFVSNSSSSSFVVVASQKVIDKALKRLSDFGREVVKTECLRRAKTITIGDMKVLVAHGTDDSESFGGDAVEASGLNSDDNEYWDKFESAQEEFGDFCRHINQLGGYASDEN